MSWRKMRPRREMVLGERGIIIFSKVNGKAFLKTGHVRQGPKERWEGECGYLGKEHSRQREQQVKRPWGRMCLEYMWDSKKARVARAERVCVCVGGVGGGIDQRGDKGAPIN